MSDQTMTVAKPEDIRQELGLTTTETVTVTTEETSALETQADTIVERLLDIDPKSTRADAARSAIETMGLDVQEAATNRSAMLREPINKIMKKTEDGGEVAGALIDLKIQVEELDPGNADLEAGWFTRLLGWLPGVGTPLKRYFTKFEESQTIIDAIVRSLIDGKDQLLSDNTILAEDQKFMRENTHKLEKAIKLAQILDQKLTHRIERNMISDLDQVKFVQEELLFPLRQRIMDLQQQLAVNQQGVITLEVLMRNNKELVRGVDRAQHVTVNALQIAVTLAMALANQKIVLDKVQAVNKTTSDLIANTAKRLKQQGTEIHKQASSAQIDMEVLKQAFTDIHAALDDISTYRQEALPKMSETIKEMDELTTRGEKKIQKMERGEIASEDVFDIVPD